MNIPKKLMWLLGYNNLGFMIDQERKHWLLKTDKKKQVQDKATGAVYSGELDNRGCEIDIESKRLPYSNHIASIKFRDDSMNNILKPEYSAFTYSSMVNGLLFERITSINYMLEDETYKNYSLQFENCEICALLFGASSSSSEVYTGKWIRTTSQPYLLLTTENSVNPIKVPIVFDDSITNIVFYYPLEEALQPLNIRNTEDDIYVTDAVNDNAYIGYPLFWFTCDQTDIGPTLTIENNHSVQGKQLMFISNEGNASSNYYAKLYVNIEGDLDATPNDESIYDFVIKCSPYGDIKFNNSSNDFDKKLNPVSIRFFDTSTGGIEYPLEITYEDDNVITMTKNDAWEYVDENTYQIPLSTFVNNLYGLNNPLISIFNVHFDESVPFYNTSSDDIGYAGIHMSSMLPKSDTSNVFPHDLNKWDGLPTYYSDLDNANILPEHLTVFAIHNTLNSSDEIPTSKQTAALIFDPGLMRTSDDSEELSNDERGRVYLLSNDEASYINNATSITPKPPRTIARICDIPTSITDFTNAEGLVPIYVVDKDYVRTEASFRLIDKDRLINTLANRIVRPVDLNEQGLRIVDVFEDQDNDYIFNSVEALDAVDLMYHNEYREYTNLNPLVDPTKIKLANITDGGSGYKVNDVGIIIIGGTAVDYHVNRVDSTTGAVLELDITPQDSSIFINLSNFGEVASDTGYTHEFGTMNIVGEDESKSVGEGLKVVLLIEDFSDILTKQDKILDHLIAFVKQPNGLMMYKYISNTSTEYGENGQWLYYTTIAEYEDTETDKTSSVSGVATSEAFINSIMPNYRRIEIKRDEDGKDSEMINTLSTYSFINIIDDEHTPIARDDISTEIDDKIHVDLCKFYTEGINHITVSTDHPSQPRTSQEVLTHLTKNNLIPYDSYVLWKWEYSAREKDRGVHYCIIRRSMNNYLTTDSTTMIPKNNIKYDSYIHSNGNTTVVWDVPDFGPMMWIYNPSYDRHEIYHINTATRDMFIEYTDEENTSRMNWKDIDIHQPLDGPKLTFVDDNGKMLYNIITNNPYHSNTKTSDSIYSDSECVMFDVVGEDYLDPDVPQLHGNWQLVHPRIDMFYLDNLDTGISYEPTKLQTIKGRNLGTVENVLDRYGYNVNEKSMLVNEESNGVSLSIFNSTTGDWEKI